MGYLYNFAFEFEVPLFFFVAGCIETLNKEKSIWKNIKKRFINIMIPFYIFAIASIILKVLLTNDSLSIKLPHKKEKESSQALTAE